jgi:uncharacterized membrane protein
MKHPDVRKQRFSTKNLAVAGLMAAMVVAGSAIRIKLPVAVGGVAAIHLGNIMCALSGILLGPWFGGAAAGIGSAVYDLFDPTYAAECWLTFLMKGAYGLIAGAVAWSGKKRDVYWKELLATIAAAVTYGVLYLAKSYVVGGLLSGEQPIAAWGIVISKLPATIFNATVAIVFAPVLASAIRKALRRSHLQLD